MSEARYRVRASAVVIRNGQILLASYEDHNGFHYNVPGGGVEDGETLMQAVVREAREETGTSVEVGRLLVVHELLGFGDAPEVAHFFECHLEGEHDAVLTDCCDTGQIGVEWVDLSALHEKPLLPPIGLLIRKALDQGTCEFIQRYHGEPALP